MRAIPMNRIVSTHISWNNRPDNWLKKRLRSVGGMALTNYLTQTVMGVVVLMTLFADIGIVDRDAVLVFVFAVWVLQVCRSQAWLNRFQFSPAEWLWGLQRIAAQPLRRPREPLGTA